MLPLQQPIIPDADHDSWTATYKNPEVWEWLLKRKRSGDKKE
jgi:predicted peptidase